MKFIDYVEIEIAAGNGGHGCVAFHTEKFVPKGGPDGGDGGRGGDIVAVADPHLTTLLDYRYQRKYKAQNGQPGSGRLRTGKSGEDTVLRLPVGTIIKDAESDQVIYDLDKPHVRPGVALNLALELKLLADVGLVGLPNAGKSTILASFSAARPKIADYPFTTLKPNLGIVKLREFKSCVMADIPGLIEGAADGKGLGHQFLRHIQRTGLLIYVIDVNEIDIMGTFEVLKQELENFDPHLVTRPYLTVITKIDTVSESDLKDVSKNLPDEYIPLSAVSRQGAREFIEAIEKKLDQRRA